MSIPRIRWVAVLVYLTTGAGAAQLHKVAGEKWGDRALLAAGIAAAFVPAIATRHPRRRRASAGDRVNAALAASGTAP